MKKILQCLKKLTLPILLAVVLLCGLAEGAALDGKAGGLKAVEVAGERPGIPSAMIPGEEPPTRRNSTPAERRSCWKKYRHGRGIPSPAGMGRKH